jgi:uncharacterized membrane protein
MTIQRGAYLIGVFDDQSHAVDALQALREAGFSDDKLNLLSREVVTDASDRAEVKVQQQAGKGAMVGAAIGGGVGATAGVLAAALIPGIGFVLTGGLLAATLGAAALGAAVGTFAGPFVALGFSEKAAHHYAHHVEAGRSVIVVNAEKREEQARSILQEHGAYDDSMNPP